MILPSQLVENCQKAPERKLWLETLPQLLDKLVALWSLRLETPFENGGTCSWVCPVVRFDGTQAVLKLAMPHMEGKHEIQGLRYWCGTSMVKLLEADDDSGAMLLERCLPGTTLRSELEPAQHVIIAGVLRRVWDFTTAAPDLADFRHLSQMIDFWCEETIAQRHLWPDPGLVEQGLRVMKELARPSRRRPSAGIRQLLVLRRPVAVLARRLRHGSKGELRVQGMADSLHHSKEIER
jgi:streptomycin 6-kinase